MDTTTLCETKKIETKGEYNGKFELYCHGSRIYLLVFSEGNGAGLVSIM
ncbi:hypothetical protein [Paenibacillus lentus]|nr:hypothetical protein [Paenibacillus lentus]